MGSPSHTDAPSALIFHGAGSCGATADRLFGALLHRAWSPEVRVTCWEDRSGSLDSLVDKGCEYLEQHPGNPSVLGGISLGAHAVMTTLLRTHPSAWPPFVIAAMPAWLGPPDATAHVTASTGREIADVGIAQTLRRISADTPPSRQWIVDTLAGDWAQYRSEELARALQTAAHQPAPTGVDLESLEVETFIIAVTGDALHPAAIAYRWAEHLPRATIVELNLADIGETGFAHPVVIEGLREIIASLG